MSFEPFILRRSASPQSAAFPLSLLGLVSTLLLTALGCGHKSAPIPPPLRHPAAARDLVVQQRGDEFILSFGFPQTTVSGTPLEPLESIEVWELVRPVPEWVPPTVEDADTTADADVAAESDAAQTEVSGEESLPDVFDRGPGSGDDPSRPEATSVEVTEDLASRTQSATEEEDQEEEASAELTDESDQQDEDTADDKAPEEETTPEVSRPSDEELLAIAAGEFVATAQLRAAVEEPNLSSASFGDRLVLKLPIETPAAAEPKAGKGEERGEPEAPTRYGSAFAVKTSIGGRFTSDFSNLVIIAHRTPPQPPAVFTLEPRADTIALSWPVGESLSEEDVVGFHVYRRDAQSPSYGPPLGFVPLESPLAASAPATEQAVEAEADEPVTRQYSDRTAILGQRYIYALTSVSKRSPVVESVITVEREVDYADRFAPRPPQNLITLAETGRIQILWDANKETDLAGYFVFRREIDGSFTRLNQEPLTEPEFSDREVQGGRIYSYRVTAVDLSENESVPSVTVDVRAP